MARVLLPPAIYLDGVLQHKQSLLQALRHAAQHRAVEGCDHLLTHKCAVSGVSIGQHLRHSLDHIRKVVDAAVFPPNHQQRAGGASTGGGSSSEAPDAVVWASSLADPVALVDYDERSRGTAVERHVALAERELEALARALGSVVDLDQPVICRFMFAPLPPPPGAGAAAAEEGGSAAGGGPAPAAAPKHLDLPSSVGRELAFAAHHAIHHNASILGILRSSAPLAEDVLPRLAELAPDFGTAPSTAAFQRQSHTQI